MNESAQRGITAGRRLLFSLFTLLLVLLVAEGLARGVQAYLAAREFPRLALAAKQPGEYRVMLFGGSTVEGAPLAEFSFVSQLEYQLRRIEPKKHLRFVNLGRSSKSSAYVRAMLDRTIELEPDLLIVLSGHNEFLFDRVDGPPTWTGSSLLELGGRLADRIVTRLAEDDSDGSYRARELDAWSRDSAEFQRKLSEYDANIDAIVSRARMAGVPLILGTLAANLADWPPAYRDIRGSYFDAEYRRRIDALHALLRSGDTEAARGRYRELVATYSETDPSLLYVGAKLLEQEGGAAAAAAEAFTLAKDKDPLPWRALSDFNAKVRAFADEPGVYVADIERAFSRFAGGPPGFELIADNCHPSPLGSALMARELLYVMSANALLIEDHFVAPDLAQMLDDYLREALEAEELDELWKRYYFTLAKYSMKGPFYNFPASRGYSERQLELDATDWRAWANLGTVSVLAGDRNRGLRQIRIAERFKGSRLDPDDRGATPYLREALDELAQAGLATGMDGQVNL